MSARVTAAIAAVVFVLALPRPGAAAGKWFKLQTENFLFIGDAPERQLRDVAQHLERFRDVMSRTLPPAAVVTAVPTVVFVFRAEGSFAPYKPRFEGRPVDVAGFFQPSDAANYMAINASAAPSALRVVFHEYAHFLSRSRVGDLPVWASEGLAGVYETFEERSGGRDAVVGVPQPGYLGLLQNGPLMSLRELLAVTNTSAVYNEGDRRGLLYAQSWALMHYLMLGSQARASQLQDYFLRVKSGEPASDAFFSAFGSNLDPLERELRDYLKAPTLPRLRLNATGVSRGNDAGAGSLIDDIEAGAYLGELLARMGRIGDAREQLRALIAADARSVRAVKTLALLELREGSLRDALPLLERAAALDPADGDIQSAWGRALFSRSQKEADRDDRAETLRLARLVLGRAVQLAPRDAEALATLGRVELSAGLDPVEATAWFERAVSAAPDDDRLRLLAADGLVRIREFSRATVYLATLVDGASRQEIQSDAKDLLAYIADALLDAQLHPDPATGAPDSVAVADRPSGRPLDVAVARYIPELRRVGPGETRVLGLFTLVECRSGSVVLRIDAESHAFRLETDNLKAVEFISYREPTRGDIGCGPVQPPARVLATFRDSTNVVSANATDGEVVAVELLPDGYTPR